MAVGIRLKFSGMTQDQFDTINKAVDRKEAHGLIFHASGPVEGGWGVIDFWESREQFDQFIANVVGPAMQVTGAAPPDVKEFPVHEYGVPEA